ncbi:MAG: glycosyltransferase [Sulfuriferula sp.]
MNKKDVAVVTITYGDRQALLRQVLDSLPAQGVARVVVVDNGAQWPVSEMLRASYGDFVDVVTMGRNTGSAGGFKAGIARAMELHTEFLWLLDDDNRPQPGCLDELLGAYARERETVPGDRLAVLAFRPEHQADVAAGVPIRHINARQDSFCGFHVLDIPYKFWRRTRWGRPRGPVPAWVRLDVAPYGGLLLGREVVQAIGVPDERFVLYADDTEHTWRITARGGRIVLVTAARIEDLESSWNIKARFGNSFAGWLRGSSELRAWYGMRNQAWFDTHRRCRRPAICTLNRLLYMALLRLAAWRSGTGDRYALLRQAAAAGRAGQLGPRQEKAP